MLIKKYLRIANSLVALASIVSCSQANANNIHNNNVNYSHHNYIGINVDRTTDIEQYHLDPLSSFEYTYKTVESDVENKKGGSIDINFTHEIGNNFFLEASAGFKKQQNIMAIFDAARTNITHTIMNSGLNLGYTINYNNQIRPFASVGFGLSNTETELKIPYGYDGEYLTNSGNTVNETEPYFNYKLGLQFITNSAIIEAGYHYTAIKDLDMHRTSDSLNLVDQDGDKANFFEFAPFQNRIHAGTIGVKFLL
jgi:opacity protein-like surface antigen